MKKNEEKIQTIEEMLKQTSPGAVKTGNGKIVYKFVKYFGIFFVVAFLVFYSRSLISSNQNQDSWIYKIPIFGEINRLVNSADNKLKGEEDGRINILLLGIGGKNHDGGNLTDTIILTSLDPVNKKVAMLSIPRDLTVPVEGKGWPKINAINAYAESESEGSGGLAISQAVSDLLNIPIDYYVRIDFQGFINIVDDLGGVNVYVDNVLEDYSYPILGQEDNKNYNSRYEHLRVETGWQKMDGSLALKYARSRHAAGVEGSDFARAKRQQKIIEAVKEKLISKYTLFKPALITDIINELSDHLSTNLKIWEVVKLYSLFKDVSKDDIINKVLDNGPNGLLRNSVSAEGAYILTPTSGDFSEIQYLVSNIFENAPKESKTKVVVEKSAIEVRNGTWVNGLASQYSVDLEKYGFDVIRVGNCSRRNFEKSVIYDLSFGKKMDSLMILKEKTGASVEFNMPEWLQEDIKAELVNETNPEQPDFILILGQDVDSSSSGTENKAN